MPDTKVEPFEFFHLYNNNSVATSIQELLWENLDQPTPLHRRCSKCEYGLDQEATETRSISEFPAVLFVHVPKFEIRIKSKISDKFLTIGNERYELYAVMDHQGVSPNSGHWIVWSKNRDNSGWLKCNDKEITEVLLEEKMFSRDNFLFAYMRCHQTSPTSSTIKHTFLSSPDPKSLLSTSREPTSPTNSTKVFSNKRTNSSPSSTGALKSLKKNTPSPVLSSKGTNDIEIKCLGCFKTFKALMKHLAKSEMCQQLYDMDDLRNESKKRSLEGHKERSKRF